MKVLILILMEHSLIAARQYKKAEAAGLNPYSNGTLSDLKKLKIYGNSSSVLILILMEHSLIIVRLPHSKCATGLNPYSNGTLSDLKN